MIDRRLHEGWQRDRDDRLDAEYHARPKPAEVEPEPAALERTRQHIKTQRCRLCFRTEADGASVIISGQCTECTESWWGGAA